MNNPEILRMELNGAPLQIEDLKTLWLSKNYGHFTVLPVYNGKVRGLQLHLDRLQQNTQLIFGYEIDTSRVLAFVRHALDTDTAPLAVWVEVFPPPSGRDPVEPDIFITVRTFLDTWPTPYRLQSVQYERDLPQAKHLGTFGRNYQYNLVRRSGFDDALFTDASRHILEGPSWNICFFDGQRIIWPNTPVLPGIATQLLQAGLKKHHIPYEIREIHLQDLPTFRSAFLTNVLVEIHPITSIDAIPFADDTELMAMLKKCYEMNAAEEV